MHPVLRRRLRLRHSTTALRPRPSPPTAALHTTARLARPPPEAAVATVSRSHVLSHPVWAHTARSKPRGSSSNITPIPGSSKSGGGGSGDTSTSRSGTGAGAGGAPGADRLAAAVRAIGERREKAGRLIAGTAAASSSDMFRALTTDKPPARRWESHLSRESLARGPCNLKMAARHLKQPGLISLGGGLPSSSYFPIAGLALDVAAPEAGFRESGPLTRLAVGKYDASRPAAAPRAPSSLPSASASASASASPLASSVAEPTYDLSIALNYAQSTGSAQLLRFVSEHVELVHAPPYADWRCAATIGSTGALEQALRMLCDGARRDSVVTDEFSFSTALETLAPLGIRAVGAPMDHEGIIPRALDELLSSWDEARAGARKPHVMYTVPSGQNPTGATMGAQRRKDIYAVCQKHDLVIIEDDPYYFLQFSSSASSSSPPSSTASSYLASLAPSLLSLDTDGRVVRLDSFSKTLVPGSRAGWITAPAQLVDRFVMHSEVANQGPAGLSQLVLHRLLDESWGHDGFLAWLAHLAGEYARRRDVLVRACEDALPGAVVSWTVPRAGMFIWLKITPPPASHDDTPLATLEKRIFDASIARGVLVAPGSWFHAEKDAPLPGLYFRATYAAASESDMAEAVRRFGGAVREVFGLE
jgi:aromatic amino acid aminotransferase I